MFVFASSHNSRTCCSIHSTIVQIRALCEGGRKKTDTQVITKGRNLGAKGLPSSEETWPNILQFVRFKTRPPTKSKSIRSVDPGILRLFNCLMFCRAEEKIKLYYSSEKTHFGCLPGSSELTRPKAVKKGLFWKSTSNSCCAEPQF